MPLEKPAPFGGAIAAKLAEGLPELATLNSVEEALVYIADGKRCGSMPYCRSRPRCYIDLSAGGSPAWLLWRNDGPQDRAIPQAAETR
jgi:hypothetical protein